MTNKKNITNNAVQTYYHKTCNAIIITITTLTLLIACFFLWLQTPNVFLVITLLNKILWLKILKQILILTACYQGFIGAKSIAMDYIKCHIIKLLFISLSLLYLLFTVVYSFCIF